MKTFTKPVTVYCDGRLYTLKPEQWQRLAPQLKGLHGADRAKVGREFMVQEGLVNHKEYYRNGLPKPPFSAPTVNSTDARRPRGLTSARGEPSFHVKQRIGVGRLAPAIRGLPLGELK